MLLDNWNSLSAHCINRNPVNTFKKHVSVKLEPETKNNANFDMLDNRVNGA